MDSFKTPNERAAFEAAKGRQMQPENKSYLHGAWMRAGWTEAREFFVPEVTSPVEVPAPVEAGTHGTLRNVNSDVSFPVTQASDGSSHYKIDGSEVENYFPERWGWEFTPDDPFEGKPWVGAQPRDVWLLTWGVSGLRSIWVRREDDWFSPRPNGLIEYSTLQWAQRYVTAGELLYRVGESK
jgi:hypothetical protein